MTSEQTPLLHGSTTDLGHPTNEDNLTLFRKAIGINIGASGPQDLESARKSSHGLYAQVIRQQTLKNRQYHLVEGLYYLAIGANIVIGATLASLGPSSQLHPTAITILGIVNTSTAGILALFKGQGLPDRLRKDEYQMRKVQDFIEETDIRLAVMPKDAFSTEELDQVVQQVFENYNAARDTSEMNRPSSYAHQPEATIKRSGTGTGTDGAGSGEASAARWNKSTLNPDANGKGKAKFVID
jgi:SMODS and SLOG-associating 2TM effector domain